MAKGKITKREKVIVYRVAESLRATRPNKANPDTYGQWVRDVKAVAILLVNIFEPLLSGAFQIREFLEKAGVTNE